MCVFLEKYYAILRGSESSNAIPVNSIWVGLSSIHVKKEFFKAINRGSLLMLEKNTKGGGGQIAGAACWRNTFVSILIF